MDRDERFAGTFYGHSKTVRQLQSCVSVRKMDLSYAVIRYYGFSYGNVETLYDLVADEIGTSL